MNRNQKAGVPATNTIGGQTTGESASDIRLGPESRINLRELHVSAEGDEFLVGDVTLGEFIVVPAVAVEIIDKLREGRTLAEVEDHIRKQTGESFDVIDFAETLVAVGFVSGLDGWPLARQGRELSSGGSIAAVVVRLMRPLYSRVAFGLYGLLFLGCVALLVGVPQLHPHATQLFFLPNPILSLGVLTVFANALAVSHELAHWIGARIKGVPARITLSRRYYMMVVQTDLTALLALPRRQRYAPLLAGLAWDTVRLSALLAARSAQLEGWWHPPPTIGKLVAALIVGHVVAMSWQSFVFLRTDVYAVLAIALGCLNLTRISRLRMARHYRKLTDTEAAELRTATPNDIRASRWYAWIQAAGLVAVVFYFFKYFIPLVTSIVRWVVLGLTRNPDSSAGFWEVLVCGIIALIPPVTPTVMYFRGRFRRRDSIRSAAPITDQDPAPEH